MRIDPADLLLQALSDSTRLYRLRSDAEALRPLLVESWRQHETLAAPWRLHIDTVAADAGLDPAAMLGCRLTLLARLADGSEYPRSGIVTRAVAADADGALARYGLTVEPWPALLARSTASRVWQEKSVTDIVDSVFADCPHAAWHWADCVAPHLASSAQGGQRSYTVQYREDDLAFVQRVLAREGIAWRLEDDASAPAGHRVVLFADSASKTSCPEDRCSASLLAGGGIRYHRAASVEAQDSIQALGGVRRLLAAQTTVLGWDYKAKSAVAASIPTAAAFGGDQAPRLEHYTTQGPGPGTYGWPDSEQARRSATLMQQALEARHKIWHGRGTVRSFTAGTHFELTESDLPLPAGMSPGDSVIADRNRFLLTAVQHIGINNLPMALSEHIAERLGRPDAVDAMDAMDGPTPGESGWPALEAGDAAVTAQAVASGYANRFEAIRARVPWRAPATAHAAARAHPGVLTATVVGPEGQGQAQGAGQIHMDALGRVRIAFDFQRLADSRSAPASTWVRVLQRWAGAGMGAQFIPRVGQQVLVDFIGGDIERPLIVASLHDGNGQGGIAPTPAGLAVESDTSAFAHSTDHSPAAQANNSGGHGPAWHGASAAGLAAGGQNNAAALSGYKSEEFGALTSGYNQLVFDDTDQQLRLQLASTQHASQLNLGHLVHQADNHRGSFRGTGFELRTDAYGAVRAGQGVLISSYGQPPAAPAGDNVAGAALQGQLAALAQTFSQAASRHAGTALAAHLGSYKANASTAHAGQAPAKALHTVAKGTADAQTLEQARADAASHAVRAGDGRVPHPGAPTVLIAAKAGIATVAGQDIQLSAGELVHMASGGDTHIAAAGAQRIHAGQSIGLLGGAIQAEGSAAGTGLTLVAGNGDIEMQAQASILQVAAQQDVLVQSKNAHIDWAAAKRIVLQTSGGAQVTIEGGNIEVMCPGKITVRASQRRFVGPEVVRTDLVSLPAGEGVLNETFTFKNELGQPMKGLPFVLDKAYARGARQSDQAGGTTRVYSAQPERVESRLRLLKIETGSDRF